MNLEKTISIARNHTALVNIVILGESNPAEMAAKELSNYLEQITEAKFSIYHTSSVQPQILFSLDTSLDGDDFCYYIYDKDLIIKANSEDGFFFAVYDFLERILACRFYSPKEEFIPKNCNLSVQFSKVMFHPAIRFRENYYKDYEDPTFAKKHKLQPAREHKGWGFWCHSFETLIPASEYFETHPEYFSLYQGKRVGEHAQLCLANPDVFDTLIENLDKHMAQQPDALYWSISQNDNDAFCTCEKCKKLDEEEESPMASVLQFVNKVAMRYPDKIISTLAYWYTRKPPKTIIPAENVHIMLCNIEANRGLPIESDPRNKDSKEELLAWKNICGNVFLWDYCIQFRNLVAPFPNLRVLAPNIRFFIENNVTALFSQSNREYHGEFSTLRGYMIAKLMCEPSRDPEEIMDEFLFGYYKQAAPFIKEYINKMHDALENNGGDLNIFGSPIDYKETFLTPELLTSYQELFRNAKEATQLDPETLFRVKTAEMPLLYAIIELKHGTKEDQLQAITAFAGQAKKIGLEKVEEWKITTEQYICDAIAMQNS